MLRDSVATTDVADGSPHAAYSFPTGMDHAELVRETVGDAVTGRRCPHVLGAQSQEIYTTVTVLAAGQLTRWQHTQRRLWHWAGGAGGNHLEGAVTWGHQLPDPATPRTERIELLAAREGVAAIRGRMPVLLRPTVALHLVDLLASMLNGQNLLGGMRMLRERVGRRIAAPTVTVVDDAGLSGPHGALLDDENTTTGRNVLLDAGVLRGFLHSKATAKACASEPNACAVRALPGGPVVPGVRGFALLPGPEADLRGLLGDGVEAVAVSKPAVRCAGGRRIRLEVFGWLVRDGQRTASIGRTHIEVGLFEWLRAVRRCGAPLHHSTVFRGLAAPPVLLADADVETLG
jgi:predicted Zn-dependent protease